MEDLTTLLDPVLRLPVGGKTYTVDPPPASIGLRLEALNAVALALQAGTQVPAHITDRLVGTDAFDLAQDALGATYQQMVDDGLSLPFIRHAGRTAYRHWVFGRQAGADYWALGADAEGKAAAG